MQFRPIVTAMAGIALGISGPAAAQPPRNQVPIFIYWVNRPPPVRINFADPRVGIIPFRPRPDHFEGQRLAEGQWVNHNVMIYYGGTSPLPLLLRTGRSMPNVRIDISRIPNPSRCNLGQVHALIDPSSLQIADGIGRLIWVRQLLTGNYRCPVSVKRTLSRYYFRTSCALAENTNYLLVSQEAESLLLFYALNSEERARNREAISACEETLTSMIPEEG
jgi:hypothetical protein